MIRPTASVNEPVPALPQSAERRAWIRYPRKLDVLWQILGMGRTEIWPAKVHDLSASGVGLTVNRSFRKGTILSVRLPRKGLEPHTCLVRVRHVTSLSAEEYQVGCTFVVPLTDHELRALLA